MSKKKLSVAAYKRKLWKVFGEYIRTRDTVAGWGECISCGKRVRYPNGRGDWHAGHYYARTNYYPSMYFNEENVNGQCRHCNTYLEGNKQGYAEGLKKKYGDDVLDRLKHQVETQEEEEEIHYPSLIEYYISIRLQLD